MLLLLAYQLQHIVAAAVQGRSTPAAIVAVSAAAAADCCRTPIELLQLQLLLLLLWAP
jgi:hypothetical protein